LPNGPIIAGGLRHGFDDEKAPLEVFEDVIPRGKDARIALVNTERTVDRREAASPMGPVSAEHIGEVVVQPDPTLPFGRDKPPRPPRHLILDALCYHHHLEIGRRIILGRPRENVMSHLDLELAVDCMRPLTFDELKTRL
jgi:hypothetical protein